MNSLENLKLLLGIYGTDEDDLLTLLREQAEQILLRHIYPFDDTAEEVPSKYAYKINEVAVYLYNRRGTEGEIRHREGEISRYYESGSIPSSLLADVMPYLRVL